MKKLEALTAGNVSAVASTLNVCGASSNASGSNANSRSNPSASTVTPTTTTIPPTTTVAASAATVAEPTTLAHSSHTGPPPAGAIEQVMKHSLYSVTAIKAKAGRLVVHLVNQEDLSVRHDMVVGDALGHRFASRR